MHTHNNAVAHTHPVGCVRTMPADSPVVDLSVGQLATYVCTHSARQPVGAMTAYTFAHPSPAVVRLDPFNQRIIANNIAATLDQLGVSLLCDDPATTNDDLATDIVTHAHAVHGNLVPMQDFIASFIAAMGDNGINPDTIIAIVHPAYTQFM